MGRRGKVRHGFVGWTPYGIRISNKKPKIFWPLRNQQRADMRLRGIGGKARRG